MLSRWRARLAKRRALAASARRAYMAHPTKAALAKLRLRRAQVVYAARVVARHTEGATVRRTPAEAAQFIASFEGGQSPDGLFRPYWDAAGRVWTIGYGHTAGVGPHSRALTQREARALLLRDLDRKYAPAVFRLGLPLTKGRAIALISAVYNLGPGVLDRGHTLGDALRRCDWKAAADALLLYDKAGGKTLSGLARRRRAERAYFLS